MPDELVEDPAYESDIQPIWDAACGASCHTEGAASGGLALDAGPEALVDAPASVPGETLVVPGDLESSYLWLKLEGRQDEVGGSGGAMPLSGSLGDNARQTIANWIEDGAPE